VEGRPDLRVDFLSSEQPIPVTMVGTYRSRALHSNHMKGHVWEEYGSETLRARPQVDGIAEKSDGGRGYYRPISLLSVWAFAPFMHNTAIGPELCGGPTDPSAELYRSPYVLRGTWQRMPNPPPCWRFDPSVEGRYKLFKASMEELLNPEKRVPKITLLARPIVIDGPSFPGDDDGFLLQIPDGIPAAVVANLRHKELIDDLSLVKANPPRLREKYPQDTDAVVATLREMLADLTKGVARSPETALAVVGKKHLPFIQRMYSNSTADVENDGHTFGATLSPEEKKALTAFLATL
jgi:hypothetical protein